MKQNRAHVVFLLISCLAVLAVAGAYVWMRSALASSMANAIAERDDNASVALLKDEGKGTASLYDSTGADRARLESLFVHSNDEVGFIVALEGVGKSSGAQVSLSSVSSGAPTDAAAVGYISAHVEAAGSFAAVMRALELVEVLPYAVTVDHVRLGTSVLGKSSALPAWSLSFDINAAETALSPTTPSVQ